MKQRIKFKLWRTNSTVHFQVLEQEGIDVYLTKKIRVDSDCPFLQKDCVYIRGHIESYDDKISSIVLLSEQEAIDYIEKVISWFDEVFHQQEPKRGNIVLVRDDCRDKWEKRIYLCKIEGAKNPYICVEENDTEDFKKGDVFDTARWKEMKQLSSNWNPETGIYEAEREV